MINIPIPNLACQYRFERLDYFAVQPYTDSYEEEKEDGDIEIVCESKFAVLAWGLDTDNVLPWEKPHFCGRFLDWFDTESEAIDLAYKYARLFNVPYKIES